ncbi:hypothetical protein BYT27DRAFT_7096350 [Phlegmacium glaucopus]|nr:hypothetical protein BYT27DRAFT_7096350 [Phlegmacium glaucopus]
MGDSSRTQAGPRQESNSNAADVNGDAYGAECSNCGTKHTPFWRRGLNDELNCNACGLYFKLHKRPRPLRYSSGGQAWPTRSPAVAAQLECYNCYTTATALWRKDDEGNTVCIACRLYYNLHGTVRPVSATSIGKRPRNDSRRRSLSSLGLGFSTIHQSQHRQRDGSFPPTLVPDCSTVFDYISQACNLVPGSHWEGHPSSSSSSGSIYSSSHHHHQLQGANAPFPNTTSSGGMDFLSFSPSDPCCELDLEPISPRTTKRRKMTTDSLSELPSSTMFY